MRDRLASAFAKPHPTTIVTPDLIRGGASFRATLKAARPRLGSRGDDHLMEKLRVVL
ncbi:hypothetical protein [Qipengyuania sp.]|uniref:hypothetical protein n=1 Tax=Qipengyuania sp. TaxID=2004515 RepID=UPI003513C210